MKTVNNKRTENIIIRRKINRMLELKNPNDSIIENRIKIPNEIRKEFNTPVDISTEYFFFR
ncbi:MAG: hypothetical protein KDC88_01925 [Ignavibacteriae bacterium]|nr:hypothetical protein [Ignavibacteriota bacterium]MCB9207743.1 hypothetical protein [Ignavibacteriales bacterium]MCB9258513.1 hypothetical protein [Ignavibacteriales bacterium]